MAVILSSFGATITKIILPDKEGKVRSDCVLGFDTWAEYDRGLDENPCLGGTVGRVANRIAYA